MDKIICKFCKLKSKASQNLNAEEIGLLNDSCSEVQFEKGDIIIKENAFSTNVAYVKSGLVKIHIKGPVREKIIKIVKAPSYLCLPSTFGDKINHFSATAIEATAVCFIDANAFKSFVCENGDFAYQILLEMSKNEIQNFHNYLNNAQKQNTGRVAETILFFAKSIYDSNIFQLPISRLDIADLTGITRESVSRILSEFHTEKIVDIKGKQISILNEKRLADISEKG